MQRGTFFRRFQNHCLTVFCGLSVFLGLAVLGSIFYSLVSRGLIAFTPALFLENTPPPQEVGGLKNAIFGSFLIVSISILIATPISVLAATFLSEYAKGQKISSVKRFMNDVWLSAPSIITGLFVYTTVVHFFGNYSALAGALALSMIALPIVSRTAEDILKLIPNELREAASALGMPKWRVITQVVWKSARPGILTGVLLAVARVSGETAPLLFTVLNNQYWSSNVTKPMANLPVTIYQFAMSPYDNWQNLAWSGALLITLFVLFLNLLTRSFSKKK